MSGRASGYSYVLGKDGKKHRVYAKPFSGSGKYRQKKTMVIGGRGGYYAKFQSAGKKYIPKGSFSKGGAAVGAGVGSFFGAPTVGMQVGSAAGALASKILGFGSYRIEKNSIIDEGNEPARMHSNSNCTVVRHREYIGDIVSSSTSNTFLNQSFAINPGLAGTFPWFQAVANQYQEWKPLGIVFQFKSLTSTAIASSTNTTIGGIVMATNYNSSAANFINKQQMDNAEYTTSVPTWESTLHAVECDMKQNPLGMLYTRSGNVPANADIKMYDLGNFQMASFGVQGSAVVLGELWVTYEIQLCKPVSTDAIGATALTDHFRLGAVTNTNTVGTTSVLQPQSSIGCTLTGGNKLNFPVTAQGNYMVTYSVIGGSVAVTMPNLIPTGCTTPAYWVADTAAVFGTPAGSTTTQGIIMFIVNIPGPGSVTGALSNVVFNSATLPSAVTNGDIWVTQIDLDITS